MTGLTQTAGFDKLSLRFVSAQHEQVRLMPGLVCFNHGKESGPWGRKIQHLARVAQAHGWAVASVDYTGLLDPEARVQKLLTTPLPNATPLVLVGSSMGGYVAAVAAATLRPAGLFLLAPAFFLPGYADPNPALPPLRLTVVHGWRDTVIPYQHSLRYAAQYHAPLHLLDDDHRLQGDLPLLEQLFAAFLAPLQETVGVLPQLAE